MAKKKAPAKKSSKATKPAKKGGKKGGSDGPSSSEIEKYLKRMNKTWTETDAAGGGTNENVEDGKQKFKLKRLGFFKTQAKKLMLEWVWEFPVDKKLLKKNPDAGVIKTRDGLETEQNIRMLKRKLAKFGYDVDQMELPADLMQVCEELSEQQPGIVGQVKTSDDGQWQNVWINKVLEDGDDDDAEEEEEEEDADDDEGDDDEEESDDDEEESDDDEDEDEESDDDEEEDDEDDEDEEEEEKPSKKSKKSKKSKGKKSKDEDDDEDEEEEEEEEDEEEEDDEEEESEIEVDSEVMFQPPRAKEPIVCVVTKITKKGEAKLKRKDNDKPVKGLVKVSELELAEEGDDEEGDEEEFGTLAKGSKVEVVIKGKTNVGSVTKEPKDGDAKVKVRFTKGPQAGNVVSVPIDDVVLLEE